MMKLPHQVKFGTTLPWTDSVCLTTCAPRGAGSKLVNCKLLRTQQRQRAEEAEAEAEGVGLPAPEAERVQEVVALKGALRAQGVLHAHGGLRAQGRGAARAM